MPSGDLTRGGGGRKVRNGYVRNTCLKNVCIRNLEKVKQKEIIKEKYKYQTESEVLAAGAGNQSGQ